MQTFMVKKKKFDSGVEIHAKYFLKEGKVWLTEHWWQGSKVRVYDEPEPWDTDNVEAVARHHDWGLYIEV